MVEGMSDVAAGITMGLATIGRPSNTGGVAMLRKLLAGCGRHIVVIGERDRQPDKLKPGAMRWPGMDGARSVTQQLAKQFGGNVGARLLPGNAKDLRAWFRSCGVDPADREACFELGRKLVGKW